MMNGLLEYSRLNTEARPFAAVDCTAVLKDAIAAVAGTIQKKAAVIDHQDLPEIEGDVMQIRQLFTALLDNALKFQPSGNVPRITIGAEEDGDFWRFCFPTMASASISVFGRKFFRCSQRLHTDNEYPGAHRSDVGAKNRSPAGGEIRVSSANDNGTVFVFTLPGARKKSPTSVKKTKFIHSYVPHI